MIIGTIKTIGTNEKISAFYRRKKRFIRAILTVAQGIFAGLCECKNFPAFFCLFAMLPIFSVTECRGRRELTRKILPFLICYDLTKTSFLLAAYGAISEKRAVGAALALAAVIATAAILLLPQIFCLSFFCNIRSGKARDIVSVSLLFSASEWLCENLSALSFPWLGVWAQAERANPLLLTANLFGCRFTSFLILLFVGIISLGIKAVRRADIFSLARCAACFAAVTGLTAAYGLSETAELKKTAAESPEINVMSVQLDCEGKEKSKMSAAEAAARYMSLINENYVGGTNVIFLPETAVHTEYSQSARAFAAFSGFAKASGCTVVTGCFFRESGKKYNSIIAFTPSGLAKGRYFKAHLVPFGEYAPLSLISRGSGLSSAASEYEPIEIGNLRLGCGICIEAAYSELFRSETANGAQLIYIPTNDSWFGESYARHANYLHSKMRAIENSRYTVRSGNCGISAVIAPWGEEIAKTESRECAAISAQAKLIDDKNLYVSVGDSFMLLPLSLAVASVVRGGKKRINRQKKS